MHTHHRGFTLIELLIALAALGVLIGIALPSYQDAATATRAAGTNTALLESITRSVQSATTSGQHVVLCPGSPNDGCADTFDWSAGWVAFTDLNGNRDLDAGESLVMDQAAAHDTVRVITSSGRRKLIIQPNGGIAGSNVTFTQCDARGRHKARSLVISNHGRMRYDTPTDERKALACGNW